MPASAHTSPNDDPANNIRAAKNIFATADEYQLDEQAKKQMIGTCEEFIKREKILNERAKAVYDYLHANHDKLVKSAKKMGKMSEFDNEKLVDYLNGLYFVLSKSVIEDVILNANDPNTFLGLIDSSDFYKRIVYLLQMVMLFKPLNDLLANMPDSPQKTDTINKLQLMIQAANSAKLIMEAIQKLYKDAREDQRPAAFKKLESVYDFICTVFNHAMAESEKASTDKILDMSQVTKDIQDKVEKLKENPQIKLTPNLKPISITIKTTQLTTAGLAGHYLPKEQLQELKNKGNGVVKPSTVKRKSDEVKEEGFLKSIKRRILRY